MIRAFIQARMSSTRFPGKVLASLKGRPVIAHVIGRVTRAVPIRQITVTTSTDASDDSLACYVRELGVSVHRGPLHNVFERFQRCLKAHPCAWFFRICADSPLLDEALLQKMATYRDRTDIDLITNIYPRTFPRGRSLEMLSAESYARIDASRLSPEEQEHLTKVYYDHPAEFRIFNIESRDPVPAEQGLAVDTPEDLPRLERLLIHTNYLTLNAQG